MKVAFLNYLPRTDWFTPQKAVDVMAIATLVEQM
jgi:hypothetical protein